MHLGQDKGRPFCRKWGAKLSFHHKVGGNCPQLHAPKSATGCCGGAVGLIVSAFTHLYRSGFNFEFETLLESITEVVADLWERKGKVSGCFKTAHFFYSPLMPKLSTFSKNGFMRCFKNFSPFSKWLIRLFIPGEAKKFTH